MQTPHVRLAQAIRQGEAFVEVLAETVAAVDVSLGNLDELVVDDDFVAARAQRMRELLLQYRDDLRLLQAAPERAEELLARLQALYDLMEAVRGEVARLAPPPDPLDALRRGGEPELLALQRSLQGAVQQPALRDAAAAALEALHPLLAADGSNAAWQALGEALRHLEQVRAELLEDACTLDWQQ